jgi:hypothetical protein
MATRWQPACNQRRTHPELGACNQRRNHPELGVLPIVLRVDTEHDKLALANVAAVHIEAVVAHEER